MNKSRPFLLLVIASACIIAAITNATIPGGSKVYEIRPQINIPEYQLYPLNTAALLEQMFEQYKTATEERLSVISADLEAISEKLNSIDSKLAQVSDRLAKIENVLLLNKPLKAVSDNNAAIQQVIDQNQIKPVLPAKK
jgi:septal ring factor EnvC (AmiA/AmiB activator)